MSHRESDDGYDGLVAALTERWRVVESSHEPSQWILQYRRRLRQPNQWTSRPPYGSFCQTRASLQRAIREKVTSPLFGMRAIGELPDRP